MSGNRVQVTYNVGGVFKNKQGKDGRLYTVNNGKIIFEANKTKHTRENRNVDFFNANGKQVKITWLNTNGILKPGRSSGGLVPGQVFFIMVRPGSNRAINIMYQNAQSNQINREKALRAREKARKEKELERLAKEENDYESRLYNMAPEYRQRRKEVNLREKLRKVPFKESKKERKAREAREAKAYENRLHKMFPTFKNKYRKANEAF
jgi:hypothetical protein